jgi:flavorubredoxin
MPNIYEIAPDVFRISVYAPDIKLQFNHFLVRDEEPLLFHTGTRAMFKTLYEQVGRVVDPARIRWIGFSHFESDECGALNQWLAAAPSAEPICGLVGGVVNLNDFSDRVPRVMHPDETFETGEHRFRFIPTPHVPHGWDAGVLFEETRRTLFCSDLFHQWGEREPLTRSDLTGRAREALEQAEAGPFANYVPYTHHTGRILEGLAKLKPQTLAVMHGSSFSGDGATALRNLSRVLEEVAGPMREYLVAAGEAVYQAAD